MLNNLFIVIMSYILEVQQYGSNGEPEHIGYIEKYFKTQAEACLYYDNHNTHMRSLNVNNNWISKLDPNTKLRYIVRDWCSESLGILIWNRPIIYIPQFSEPPIET